MSKNNIREGNAKEGTHSNAKEGPGSNEQKCTESNKLISFKEVSFQYDKTPKEMFRIHQMDLTIFNGDITFLLGENGSGKTTISKLMAGILKPQEGNIFIGKENTKDLNLGQIGERIGYLWQRPELQLFAPTVLEELTFVDRIKKKNVEESLQQAIYWLSYFDLLELKNRGTFHLSKGEKQRLALAANLSHGAQYFILDEPTTGLDSERKEALIHILKKLNAEEGIGMTVISHDETFINAFPEKRILWIEKGGIIKDEYYA